MSKIYCFCGMKLAEVDNGNSNEYVGVCPLCQKTNDATKSCYFKENKPTYEPKILTKLDVGNPGNIRPLRESRSERRSRK